MSIDVKPNERILNDLESTIQREFNIRNIIDTKIFTSIGVITSIIAILFSQFTFPYITVGQVQPSVLSIILFYLGLAFIIIAILRLLFNITPKIYPALDYSILIESDSTFKDIDLLVVLIRKKNNLIIQYQHINLKKANALLFGIWFAVCGIALMIVSKFF